MVIPSPEKGCPRKILVTGAAGFIGANVVRALSQRGFSVRAAIHRKETIGRLRDAPVEMTVGDILDKSFVKSAVEGIWAVVHLAAIIKGTDKKLIYRTNADGTANLIEACKEEKIKRIVFISTPQAFSSVSTPYGASKRAAEERIKSSTLDWTIFRPVLVYGPGDTKDLTRMVYAVSRWPVIPILGNGKIRIQPVYIDDLVQSIVRALENDISIGKTYEVGGMEALSLNEFIGIAAMTAGKNCYSIHVPLSFAMIVTYILGKVCRKPILTTDVVKAMIVDKTADIGPLYRDLGVAPRNVQEGLKALLAAKA